MNLHSQNELSEGEEDTEAEDLEVDLLLPRMPNQVQSKGLLSMNKSVYALTFLSAVGGFLFG